MCGRELGSWSMHQWTRPSNRLQASSCYARRWTGFLRQLRSNRTRTYWIVASRSQRYFNNYFNFWKGNKMEVVFSRVQIGSTYVKNTRRRTRLTPGPCRRWRGTAASYATLTLLSTKNTTTLTLFRLLRLTTLFLAIAQLASFLSFWTSFVRWFLFDTVSSFLTPIRFQNVFLR